jgi:hypothetical protein
MGIPKAYPENPCTLVLGSVKTAVKAGIDAGIDDKSTGWLDNPVGAQINRERLEKLRIDEPQRKQWPDSDWPIKKKEAEIEMKTVKPEKTQPGKPLPAAAPPAAVVNKKDARILRMVNNRGKTKEYDKLAPQIAEAAKTMSWTDAFLKFGVPAGSLTNLRERWVKMGLISKEAGKNKTAGRKKKVATPQPVKPPESRKDESGKLLDELMHSVLRKSPGELEIEFKNVHDLLEHEQVELAKSVELFNSLVGFYNMAVPKLIATYIKSIIYGG